MLRSSTSPKGTCRTGAVTPSTDTTVTEFLLINFENSFELEVQEYCFSTFPDDEEFMCVFDSGSSVVSFCTSLLFLDGSIKPCNPVPIRNSSQTYSRINNKGSVPGFDSHTVYYDRDQFINILSQHFVLSNPHLFKVEELKSSRGFLYGYV